MTGKYLITAVVGLVALGALSAAVTFSGDDASRKSATGISEALSDGQRSDVRNVIREYLIENPGVIVEALEVLQARQEAIEQTRSRQALATHRDALIAAEDDPVLGPDTASVTIVEFFDYQCPYCKRMTGALMGLAAEDDDLRIVFKEFPILGEASVLASRAALAAAKQGKYAEFHVALMNNRGRPSQESIARIAKTLDLDIDRLREDMKSPEIDQVVQANYRLAQAIGVTGTPAFVVGDELIPGAVDIARLRELVEKERAGES